MKKGIAAIAVAATMFGGGAATTASSPADDEALREQVEQTFADYLDSLDPIGSQFYAAQCEFLDYEVWHCTAIDEGVVSVFIEPQLVEPNTPVVTQAEHYSPEEGSPLPR